MAKMVCISDLPQIPPPHIELDFHAQHLLNLWRYVSIIMRTDKTLLFDTARELKIGPSLYEGDLEPLDEPLWVLLCNHPLEDVEHRFNSLLIYPGTNSHPIFTQEIIPILNEVLHIRAQKLPRCF
jgi:hypothetical protein